MSLFPFLKNLHRIFGGEYLECAVLWKEIILDKYRRYIYERADFSLDFRQLQHCSSHWAPVKVCIGLPLHITVQI